jgi:DegV family protein with EDD domain
MAKVKIICSSTGALKFAPERYQKYDIDLLQIHMTFKGVEYFEGEMDPVKFYEELETMENPKNNLPKTSVPSLLEIAAHFDKAIEEGYDTVLAFCISSGLGGTYNAVRLAAKDYADKLTIHVIDTKVAGFSEGLHALRAAQLLEKGYTVEQILQETDWAIRHQEFVGVEGKLDYLIYNGRLKGAKAFMGQMLKICPVLHFNKNGEIEAVESIRTQKKALNRLCEYLKELIGDRDPKDYVLYHLYTGEGFLNLLKEIEQKNGVATNHEDVIMTPASGCHNGPWLAGYGLYRIRREDEALDS